MSVYNFKDIIRMNQDIGEKGQIINGAGIDYALDRTYKEKSWLRQAALLIRAIICDHAFEDGNKRTAFILFALMCEEHDYEYDQKNLVSLINKISRESTSNISILERLLKNVIRR
jgi:death-on-curing family protein